MILPIVAYGTIVLKQRAVPISKDYNNINTLIDNMWDTMYAASGVGLAAPQIGISIRLFVVDTAAFANSENLSDTEIAFLVGFKRVFINPIITKETGITWDFKEGCLSS